jgi:hypothetical protein
MKPYSVFVSELHGMAERGRLLMQLAEALGPSLLEHIQRRYRALR